jgi:hypothetical protein
MQAWGLALDKPYDVVSTQACQSYRSIAEPIGEEPADEGYVVDDGCFGQRALVAQVVRERVRGSLNRGQPAG